MTTGTRESNLIQAVGFSIGDEEYALPIETVKEVLVAPHITRVPHAPSYIMGVVNLRGNIIPVMDVAHRLQIGETKLTQDSRIVAVEQDNDIVAIAAESVSKVTRLAASEIKDPPGQVAGIASDFIYGVARKDSRFLIFLNMERVLDGNEEGMEHAN